MPNIKLNSEEIVDDFANCVLDPTLVEDLREKARHCNDLIVNLAEVQFPPQVQKRFLLFINNVLCPEEFCDRSAEILKLAILLYLWVGRCAPWFSSRRGANAPVPRSKRGQMLSASRSRVKYPVLD